MAIEFKRTSAIQNLNVIPLIDIVFFLLIFYLVVSKFEQEESGLAVQLPSAASAMPMTVEPQEMTVAIDERGTYAVDGKVMDENGLRDSIQQAVTNNPFNQSVIIRGDRRVPFQFVVNVMDLCNQLKVRDYKVTTDTPAG
jgi:biopolymer transport protein ExbD